MFYLSLFLFFFILFDGMIVSVFDTGTLFEPMLTTMGLIVLSNFFSGRKLFFFTTIFALLFSLTFSTIWLTSAVNIICTVYICHYIARYWNANIFMIGAECIIGISILMLSSYFAVLIAGSVTTTFIEFAIKYIAPTLAINLLLLPIVYALIKFSAGNIIDKDLAKKYK